MYLCILCRTHTEIDDALFPLPSGRCICLLCWERETKTRKVLAAPYRREVIATLDGISGG